MLRVDKRPAQTSYKLGTKGSFLLDVWPDSQRVGEKGGILPCEESMAIGQPSPTKAVALCWERPTGRRQNWGGGAFLEGECAV
ncbi:rCG34242 [Rattus norvegicus]|uniref:RCG34242 n=1 Tax=Rattus norvegicus TaxID=10116 RepID=A6HJZ1_RAT|nr:rCG34242 [Rattus norvegicus]